MRIIHSLVIFLTIILVSCGTQQDASNRHDLSKANTVTVGGILGEAIDANVSGRLSTFISSANSPAIAMFNADKQEPKDIRNWRTCRKMAVCSFQGSYAYRRSKPKKQDR